MALRSPGTVWRVESPSVNRVKPSDLSTAATCETARKAKTVLVFESIVGAVLIRNIDAPITH